jgi:hypothetical protein
MIRRNHRDDNDVMYDMMMMMESDNVLVMALFVGTYCLRRDDNLCHARAVRVLPARLLPTPRSRCCAPAGS